MGPIQVQQCRWWLDRELGMIDPQFVMPLAPLRLALSWGARWSSRASAAACCAGRMAAEVSPPSIHRRSCASNDEASMHSALSGLVSDLRQAVLLANEAQGFWLFLNSWMET